MNLIAPTAFKGTMSPLQAARYLAAPDDRLLPLSDGGDGFLECLHHGLGGTFEQVAALDPFGHEWGINQQEEQLSPAQEQASACGS